MTREEELKIIEKWLSSVRKTLSAEQMDTICCSIEDFTAYMRLVFDASEDDAFKMSLALHAQDERAGRSLVQWKNVYTLLTCTDETIKRLLDKNINPSYTSTIRKIVGYDDGFKDDYVLGKEILMLFNMATNKTCFDMMSGAFDDKHLDTENRFIYRCVVRAGVLGKLTKETLAYLLSFIFRECDVASAVFFMSEQKSTVSIAECRAFIKSYNA